MSINNDPYLTDIYKIVLVEETLSKYFLVTKEEKAALINALITGKLPELINPRAKTKIVEFFNKLNLYSRSEMQEIAEFIRANPRRTLLKLYTKITANNQLGLFPRASLDKGGDIKSPFRILKEAYKGDWLVYLIYLARTLPESKRGSFIKRYSDPKFSFEKTLKGFLSEGVLINNERGDAITKSEFESRYSTREAVLDALRNELNYLPIVDVIFIADRLRINLDDTKKEMKELKPHQNANIWNLESRIKDIVMNHLAVEGSISLEELMLFLIEVMLVKQIITQWIMYRVDNVVKTVRTSTESSRIGYQVFLKHALGLDYFPSQEEMLDYWAGILNYNVSNPNAAKNHWQPLIRTLQDVGWRYAQWQKGVPLDMPLTIVDNSVTPETAKPFAGWGFKVDNWTYALTVAHGGEVDEDDGVIFNTDWEHTIYPTDVFLLPFVAYEFTRRKDLGIVLTELRDADEGMTPTAKDQIIAEDVWNTRMLPAENRIGATAMYGPCIVRLPAMRYFGANTSKIEDSATAQEILKRGYKTDYAPGITMGRGREKTHGRMPGFVNRFGGLVVDNSLTPHFQQMLASPRIHWTEKLTLLFNDDHYINQALIPRYNLAIFLFSFFVSFTPFAYLAVPGFFIVLQYIFSQAITTGGIRNYIRSNGTVKGYLMYLGRFWSLIFTFISLIPNDAHKTIRALCGESGVFLGGAKDVKYASEKFTYLYDTYRQSIKWGVILLGILLLSPLHPYGIAGQIFFFVFPFAFIFGPFMKNGHSRPLVSGFIFGGAALAFMVHNFVIPFAPMIALGICAAFVVSSIIAAITGEKYNKGIWHGLIAIIEFLIFDFIPVNRIIRILSVFYLK
ncbi:MAG: hypothetical protein KKE64_00685, partial [Candidatus Omnitrophica bacterium]|nr:hypothetical protein [Candidatus Omnitrophota bacterium]